jgi:hypothetical protein
MSILASTASRLPSRLKAALALFHACVFSGESTGFVTRAGLKRAFNRFLSEPDIFIDVNSDLHAYPILKEWDPVMLFSILLLVAFKIIGLSFSPGAARALQNKQC